MYKLEEHILIPKKVLWGYIIDKYGMYRNWYLKGSISSFQSNHRAQKYVVHFLICEFTICKFTYLWGTELLPSLVIRAVVFIIHCSETFQRLQGSYLFSPSTPRVFLVPKANDPKGSMIHRQQIHYPHRFPWTQPYQITRTYCSFSFHDNFNTHIGLLDPILEI